VQFLWGFLYTRTGNNNTKAEPGCSLSLSLSRGSCKYNNNIHMLACISLKEKKKNAFAFAKKKRVVVLPPFYIYSYIGISSSAFLTIILFSKKNPKSFSFFLSFWPGARHP
jgi:hypothetical protein